MSNSCEAHISLKATCQLCKSGVPKFDGHVADGHIISYGDGYANFIPCTDEDRAKMEEMSKALEKMDKKEKQVGY